MCVERPLDKTARAISHGLLQVQKMALWWVRLCLCLLLSQFHNGTKITKIDAGENFDDIDGKKRVYPMPVQIAYDC
jgi:hypothetical protein